MRFATWTAFESFMQDTWLVVVNARPVPLAQRVVEPSANLETGMQMKQLSMKEIANAGFDLRGAMGSLLLRQKAVDFQQFKTIRAAYKVAFAGELESAFEPCAVDLSFLEAFETYSLIKAESFTKNFSIERGTGRKFPAQKLGM
jgi:hypothetical protein